MAKKLYDLAVKLGTYTDAQGNEKGRWLTVGAVMQNQDGGKYIMLERWFNPAGVPNPDNRSNVLLSMFEPQQRNGNGNGQQQRPAQQRPQQSGGVEDDDIPF